MCSPSLSNRASYSYEDAEQSELDIHSPLVTDIMYDKVDDKAANKAALCAEKSFEIPVSMPRLK